MKAESAAWSFWQICERGFARLGSALSEPHIGMAHARLDDEIAGHATSVYLGPDPTNPLIARCVEVLLPIAEIAFGNRAQLLRAELTETPHWPTKPERSWHRDLPVETAMPLSITAIFYLDPIHGAGNTFIIPLGLHPPGFLDRPDDRELAIDASIGDCVLLTGSIWHSGSTPLAEFRRRTLVLQCGYWWIKQQPRYRISTGSLEETVYGAKAPPGDLYITDR